MGGEQFDNFVRKTELIASVEEAFRHAQDNARYMYGHGGYTGTIAEKPGFVMRNNGKPVSREKVIAWGYQDGEDNDKWGPAYCVPVTKEEGDKEIGGWFFYGWASS
jgi:hypothetical protein